MTDFVANTSGLSFTFLNELDGRTCHTQDEPIFKHNASACVGDWDPSNTIEFLQYIKHNGLTSGLVALELGNELTRMQRGWKGALTINQTIRDLHALSAVLDKVWPDARSRPKLMGPADNICVEEDASRIMQTSVLDIFSFHSYPDGSGGGHISHNEIAMPNLWADLSNATWLRQSGPESNYAVQQHNRLYPGTRRTHRKQEA